jgi:hypothetical protein
MANQEQDKENPRLLTPTLCARFDVLDELLGGYWRNVKKSPLARCKALLALG